MRCVHGRFYWSHGTRKGRAELALFGISLQIPTEVRSPNIDDPTFNTPPLVAPLSGQVIQRIFYVVNRSWSGRVTMTELRRSNFLQTLALLEEEDDINQITDYFSYEHFYVIYCKFWELDTDHDLYIDPKDLARYNDHGEGPLTLAKQFLSGSGSFNNDLNWNNLNKI